MAVLTNGSERDQTRNEQKSAESHIFSLNE